MFAQTLNWSAFFDTLGNVGSFLVALVVLLLELRTRSTRTKITLRPVIKFVEQANTAVLQVGNHSERAVHILRGELVWKHPLSPRKGVERFEIEEIAPSFEVLTWELNQHILDIVNEMRFGHVSHMVIVGRIVYQDGEKEKSVTTGREYHFMYEPGQPMRLLPAERTGPHTQGI